jgi:hypothetical protein
VKIRHYINLSKFLGRDVAQDDSSRGQLLTSSPVEDVDFIVFAQALFSTDDPSAVYVQYKLTYYVLLSERKTHNTTA